jgi:putative DNA primase/helicase
LHAPRLKDITGGERMTVRHLYGHPFTFRPTCKIWLSVNELPRVADDSDGLWRRLKQVPFTQRFEGAADDRGLKDALRAEAPGILAWLVRGCLEWQARGLDAPAAVDDVTASYRRDSDHLGQFIEEACELDRDAEIGATDLYQHYIKWAQAAGLSDRERWTVNLFGRKCGERFKRVPTKVGNVYLGLARRIG